jgi:hypothetical protein
MAHDITSLQEYCSLYVLYCIFEKKQWPVLKKAGKGMYVQSAKSGGILAQTKLGEIGKLTK